MSTTIEREPGGWNRFAEAARAAEMDPHDRWVGGYADYEWAHLRPVLAAYGIDLDGADVLELGCNVGASSVVMGRLGARVVGVDVDERHVGVARANLAMHGLTDQAGADHVADTRRLPYADGRFDFALANSVLEYVRPDHLPGVIAEMARVLRPKGRLLICGTASRLAPREIHSGRWLVNYLPRVFDGLVGREMQRGLSPVALASAMGGQFDVVQAGDWIHARRAVHGTASFPVRIVDRLARSIGIAPGWIAPHIELLCRRR